MRFENENIRFQQIDIEDHRYRISTALGSEGLIGSVRRSGLLNPPILESKKTRFAVISGFRRIDACLRLGWEHIPVRIVDEKTPQRDRILLAVAENSLQRPLNLIETSRALNLLSPHFSEPSDLGSVCRDLCLPDTPEHIRKILRLSRLPVRVQAAVLEGAVSLSMALALDPLETETAVLLCEIFQKLKIGFNVQQESILWLREIAARDGISERKILEDPDFLSIITDRDLDLAQQRQAVRKYFKRRRYPTFAKHEETFEKYRARLPMGSSIKLEPPPFFEGRSYTITIRFSSLSDLEERISTLSKLSGDITMKKILTFPQ
jgi:ParB family chromosome partitioning protein